MERPIEPMHLDPRKARAVVDHMNAVSVLIGHDVIAVMVNNHGEVDWVLPEAHVPALRAVLDQMVRVGRTL